MKEKTIIWQEAIIARSAGRRSILHLSDKAETRGYWKSKIEPRKSPPESSRIGRALKLLKELKAQPDANEEEIFVLCLFLSHARQLALRQEFKKMGNTYQLYEILRQEEFMTIKSLNLSQIQIETIQKSLAQKLNGPSLCRETIEDFAIYLMSERGLSANTLEAYRRDMQTFHSFLQAGGLSSWNDVQQQQLIDFLS